ncbi:unnamed protein product [Cylindrotheca closterium]|uniref:Uncharacterized protein n=1 Tax=Cylindrotheca closterium TaxID=2856 RepID=A0AAD2JJA7_9STRA|nr:unnamed protein product [Cylindrotheca closterium]
MTKKKAQTEKRRKADRERKRKQRGTDPTLPRQQWKSLEDLTPAERVVHRLKQQYDSAKRVKARKGKKRETNDGRLESVDRGLTIVMADNRDAPQGDSNNNNNNKENEEPKPEAKIANDDDSDNESIPFAGTKSGKKAAASRPRRTTTSSPRIPFGSPSNVPAGNTDLSTLGSPTQGVPRAASAPWSSPPITCRTHASDGTPDEDGLDQEWGDDYCSYSPSDPSNEGLQNLQEKQGMNFEKFPFTKGTKGTTTLKRGGAAFTPDGATPQKRRRSEKPSSAAKQPSTKATKSTTTLKRAAAGSPDSCTPQKRCRLQMQSSAIQEQRTGDSPAALFSPILFETTPFVFIPGNRTFELNQNVAAPPSHAPDYIAFDSTNGTSWIYEAYASAREAAIEVNARLGPLRNPFEWICPNCHNTFLIPQKACPACERIKQGKRD